MWRRVLWNHWSQGCALFFLMDLWVACIIPEFPPKFCLGSDICPCTLNSSWVIGSHSTWSLSHICLRVDSFSVGHFSLLATISIVVTAEESLCMHFFLYFIFSDVNPMGQVPAIVDGRFKLFERYWSCLSFRLLCQVWSARVCIC